MASSCRAERTALSMTDSGIDSMKVTSGGGTLDSVLVSTTRSGWARPIVAAGGKTARSKSINQSSNTQTFVQCSV